jgi:hypothetical protein
LSPAQPIQDELDCLLSRFSGQSLPEAGKNYMAEQPQNRIWKFRKCVNSKALSGCLELEMKLPIEIRREKAIPPAPASVCNERKKG